MSFQEINKQTNKRACLPNQPRKDRREAARECPCTFCKWLVSIPVVQKHYLQSPKQKKKFKKTAERTSCEITQVAKGGDFSSALSVPNTWQLSAVARCAVPALPAPSPPPRRCPGLVPARRSPAVGPRAAPWPNRAGPGSAGAAGGSGVQPARRARLPGARFQRRGAGPGRAGAPPAAPPAALTGLGRALAGAAGPRAEREGGKERREGAASLPGALRSRTRLPALGGSGSSSTAAGLHTRPFTLH